jgi:putative transposase
VSYSITLTPQQRTTLLRYYRGPFAPQLRLRAHILLLLDDGCRWDDIARMLYCSSRTIDRWRQRFLRDGLAGLPGQPPGPHRRLGQGWMAVVATWVLRATPRAFGFMRSRWCCATLALLLWRQHRIDVSSETVRRWLHRADIVWRRPRLALKRRDERRQEILAQLRQLLQQLPDDETAVFQDEVDINLNPKIGCMWMRRGQQAQVVTPGDNRKCYLAGSLHWRTGKLLTTMGAKRDGALFVRQLHDLRRRLRRYRVIHVICDNAKFHYDCWAVWKFCQQYGDRVKLHFLPKYAPELNPIERVWWRLHELITWNHQCTSLNELVDLALAWLWGRKGFKVQGPEYLQPTPQHQPQAA